MSSPSPWQLRIFSKSLKKKEKLELIRRWLPRQEGHRILDLGCAKGTLSYLMRRMGGQWVHADLDRANLQETLALVRRGVVKTGPAPLPFGDQVFDTVVTLDFIEHVQGDGAVLQELHRTLKRGGSLLVSTPVSGRGLVLNQVKRWVGLPPEVYGHVREGYGLTELARLLEVHGFRVLRQATYARFFTELIELAINLAFRLLKRGARSHRRDGSITPGSGRELQAHGGAFRLYSLIYPFTWSLSRLDRVIPFTRGYATLILAERT